MEPKPGPPWLKTTGSASGCLPLAGTMATARSRVGLDGSECSSSTTRVPHLTSLPSTAPAGILNGQAPGAKRGTPRGVWRGGEAGGGGGGGGGRGGGDRAGGATSANVALAAGAAGVP